MTVIAPGSRRSIAATTLTTYVRLDNCERFLHLQLRHKETSAMLAAKGLRQHRLSPLLTDVGARFEQGAVERLKEAGYAVVDLGSQNRHVRATLAAVQAVASGERAVVYQGSVAGMLGDWPCHGDADLVRVRRGDDGALDLLVADIKASAEDRLEHRLQVSLYAVLLRQMLEAAGERVSDVQGVIVHRAHEHGPLDLDALEPFDLSPYLLALDHLVVDPTGPVTRAADAPLQDVPYHLTWKCDGCPFNTFCLRDTAERHDLSLIPMLTAAEKRILRSEGITSVEQLAAVKQPPEPGARGPLPVTPGQEATVARLADRWRVGANLDILSQRARAFAHRYDATVAARGWLHGSGFGSLPAGPADGLPLIKVFLDAQHDFMQDRIYMAGALVAGPGGDFLAVEMTDGPPDEASEGALLQRWAPQVYAAVAQAAGVSEGGAVAYVHLYLYDRRDQTLLLEALRRHLSELNMAALFDLLTAAPGADSVQEPGLAQPMLSFLAQEFQEHRNPALTCQPLHNVARSTGFNWDDGTRRYQSLFSRGVFDNRHTIRDGGNEVWVETASRFSSQVPLEYAYGVWGKLPKATSAAEQRQQQPWRAVTRDDLLGFMAHRMRALQHIEAKLTLKNSKLDKRPLNLVELAFQSFGEVALPRAVEEFLFIEHYTRLQTQLLAWSRPVEERARQGRAMLVECIRTEGLPGNSLRAHFRLRCDLAGVEPSLALHQLSLKEGDWVVVNRAEDDQTPRKMLHGRLGIIQSLTDSESGPSAVIDLLGATFFRNRFRYSHDNKLLPEPGDLLLVDVMADDLNADKHLEATRAARVRAAPNALLTWLEQGAERNARAVDTAMEADLRQVLGEIRRAAPHPPTPVQEDVIAGGLGTTVRLVQGPPGTGKSHTLGWAVLAQMAAAHRSGRPAFRVAVSAKTHNAVNIVLASIRDKLTLLQRQGGPLAAALASLRIVKIVNDDDDDNVPAGVEAFSSRARSAPSLLNGQLLVVGGAPGGLYTLARTAGGPEGMWALRPFDLLVVDEASQMNLPEAVTAAALLKPGGRMLVVGDHRQMAPIVAHNWDEEERRTVKSADVYRSLFEYLLSRGFPAVALDQSFRLHRDLARFLHGIIYRHDGVDFHSHQTHALALPPGGDPLVAATLAPDYPVVVIEHDEADSQQFNGFEGNVVERLLAALTAMGLDGTTGVGVVVPHRAQRALLQQRFPSLERAGAIDTVERFQGGERDVIIVSATASDPDFVLGEAGFLLDPNRLNVAISRPRKKLIVVASRTVFRLICADLDVFENAVLWKRLRYTLTDETLWEGAIGGVGVRVLGRRVAEG